MNIAIPSSMITVRRPGSALGKAASTKSYTCVPAFCANHASDISNPWRPNTWRQQIRYRLNVSTRVPSQSKRRASVPAGGSIGRSGGSGVTPVTLP